MGKIGAFSKELHNRFWIKLQRLIGSSLMLSMLVLLWPAGTQASESNEQSNKRVRESHALWAHPPDVGKNAFEVRQFVERCKRAGIDTIVILVKGAVGEIYWKSERFAQAIANDYKSFDILEHLTREAKAAGIKVDAWLCDFLEGPNGPAYSQHPEWAQLNPDGGNTTTEKLGLTRPYPYVWMCPARRPGYTDQWLLPMIEEVARYDVNSIHHDYVRYPGDIGPDSYCFCDYCLENIPRYAMLSYETRAEERYRVRPAQPRIEANWWSDPTMLPIGWDKMDRREKANYILNGRTIPGGPPDMRYFFYDYRVQQIDNFVREARERIRRINPKIEISAAVFKNPVLSGRFIGQRWHEWSRWVDVLMPMTYRSHFAGSFESYLDHLTETTARQLEWVRHEKPVYAGIATTYLYREEMQPFDDLRDRIAELKETPASNTKARAELLSAISLAFETMSKRLAEVAPQRERELRAQIAAVTAGDGKGATDDSLDRLTKSLNALRNDLPPGFLPPEKLLRSIEAARKAKPEGIAIFAAGNLTREKLWEALEKAFSDPK